ncbi:MAG: Hsp20/alpha crystallin family protein, partial [Rhodospirillaceae bacterium]|nr:Hsp20/alpha crystallin family protein [Rhodospirillaceae bacterium]
MLFTQLDDRGWNPFAELRQLQADMGRLFETASGAQEAPAYPPVNLWVGDDSVAVTAELPGLSRDEINLTVREDTLTIQGERKPAANDNRAAWYRRERTIGSFARTIALPYRVDPEQVKARLANGLLEVEIQRPTADLPRKIQIT